MNTEKTAEQVAAEVEPAAAEKQAVQERKAAEKAEAKAKREAEAVAKKANREAEKAAKKEAAEAEKAAKKAEKEQAKLDAVAAKEAARMPEQNGIRRPKPEGLCGRAWAIFDSISAKHGSPASVKESLEEAVPQGLKEGNVKAEYARWRKFHGITGRILAPVAPVEEEAAPVEQA